MNLKKSSTAKESKDHENISEVREDSENSQAKKTPLLLKGMKIGELLLKEGFLKKGDLHAALSIQRQEKKLYKRPLGKILVKMDLFFDAPQD